MKDARLLVVVLGLLWILSIESEGTPVLSPNVQVDDGQPETQYTPAVACDGNGVIYVTWVDMRNYRRGDIYFSKSTDGGRTWLVPNVRVSSSSIDVTQGTFTDIEVDADGSLYVVWSDHRERTYYPYFARSTDGGLSWSTNIRLIFNSSKIQVI